MNQRTLLQIIVALVFFKASAFGQRCDGDQKMRLAAVVNETIEPLLKEHEIPGMAVAVTVNGQRYLFSFGVGSKESGRRVTENTIFEIGSISKVFTATLAAYSESLGKLAFSDPVSRHVAELAGSSFDKVNLIELMTYTPGGLPLQFPEAVTNREEMVAFYRNWRPDFPPSTHRQYSNPSIGLAGHVAAKSLGQPFEELMEKRLFPMLGLANSYINVPANKMGDYAFGYNAQGRPIRVSPGVLAAEAYGVKTTAKDLVGLVERISDPARIQDAAVRKAIGLTRRGYYQVGVMTQGLAWEMYNWPTALGRLLEGNSVDMIFKANPAQVLTPPVASRDDVLINKTGSTNGFGAYVAFVPSKRIGVVMLANKSYAIPARVTAAHRILTAMDRCLESK